MWFLFSLLLSLVEGAPLHPETCSLVMPVFDEAQWLGKTCAIQHSAQIKNEGRLRVAYNACNACMQRQIDRKPITPLQDDVAKRNTCGVLLLTALSPCNKKELETLRQNRVYWSCLTITVRQHLKMREDLVQVSASISWCMESVRRYRDMRARARR